MRYIPKIIHFIWFGGSELPPLIQRCFDSWKKFCPDYEFMIWNEDNFDINSNLFVREAYEKKKYAFVSDYVRLYVLYKYGGVYADSDCEIIKDFNRILDDQHVVTGYSTDRWIPTAFLAAERGNKWIKRMLDYYDDRHFVLKSGNLDLKPNNAIITEISVKEYGFKAGKDCFIEYGGVKIYPRQFFHPFRKEKFDNMNENIGIMRGIFDVTDDTICIHYSVGKWDDETQSSFVKWLKKTYRRIMPKQVVKISENLFYRLKYWGDSE